MRMSSTPILGNDQSVQIAIGSGTFVHPAGFTCCNHTAHESVILGREVQAKYAFSVFCRYLPLLHASLAHTPLCGGKAMDN